MDSPRSFLLLLGLLGPGLFAGCGPATATVSGEVHIDGKPLDAGIITYVPAEGRGAPVTASIHNGKYQLQTTPGKKLVQISAPHVIGKRPEYDGPGAALVEITEERLPDRYHSKTELTFDVQPGSNAKDWSVQSKAKKP